MNSIAIDITVIETGGAESAELAARLERMKSSQTALRAAYSSLERQAAESLSEFAARLAEARRDAAHERDRADRLEQQLEASDKLVDELRGALVLFKLPSDSRENVIGIVRGAAA
ncbi:hypothetical protein [Chromobacterium violaceum]|uniref:Uncharacterized protein n=1 Tax=Chromobacterium violaceum TaxID=536 RepID=A0A202BD76_CHRVL|nr:hypothetical protein [Chromobacterium violaceum]OVE49419.1 hypothetical protein CBW21_05925 [Chromobacterium violaceum]